MSKKLNVGIIGCGFVAKYNVDAWRRLGHEVTALCDINPENLFKSKKEYGVNRCYASSAEMYKDNSLDAVSICTIPFNHATLVQEALDHNCLVAVEKPFVTSTKEAEPFRKTKNLVVLHTQAFEGIFHEAFEYIRKSYLAFIHEVHVDLMQPETEMMTANPNHWAYKMRGGRTTESLPHIIYEAQGVIGDDLQLVFVESENFADKKTYREMRAQLQNKNTGATSLIHIKMDAPRDVDSVVAFGCKGVLTAGLNPQHLHVQSYSDSKLPQPPKSACKYNSRYLLIKSLLDGSNWCNGEHAYHNIRLSDEIVDRVLCQKSA